jgi:hypothetical protein
MQKLSPSHWKAKESGKKRCNMCPMACVQWPFEQTYESTEGFRGYFLSHAAFVVRSTGPCVFARAPVCVCMCLRMRLYMCACMFLIAFYVCVCMLQVPVSLCIEFLFCSASSAVRVCLHYPCVGALCMVSFGSCTCMHVPVHLNLYIQASTLW